MIHVHKERSSQVTSENETLQEQLDERYQELEKIKVNLKLDSLPWLWMLPFVPNRLVGINSFKKM